MIAVQYIIGMMNAPVDQMIGFIRSAQDAKISLERLGEVHFREDEEPLSEQALKIHELDTEQSIELSDVSYQYDGPRSPLVLDKVNLRIPQNRVTAIVGTSGSGKTTLLKLLLGFYKPVEGEIRK